MRKDEFPLSLLLGYMSKKELLYVAEVLNAKIAKNLKRENTAQKLSQHILENPLNLLEHLPEHEVLRLQKMVHSENSEVIISPFRSSEDCITEMGLTDCYTEKDCDYEFIYPDLVLALAPVIDTYVENQPLRKEKIHRERLIIGLLNLYGILSVRKLTRHLKPLIPGITEKEVRQNIDQSYLLNSLLDEEARSATLFSPLLEDEVYIRKEITFHKNLKEAIFSEEQILEAGDPEFPMWHNEYTEKMSLELNKDGKPPKEIREWFSYIWVSANNGEDISTLLFEEINRSHPIPSREEAHNLIRYLTDLVNHFPLWMLSGNSPQQAGVELPEHILPLFTYPEEEKSGFELSQNLINDVWMEDFIFPYEKTGRNAPCPCGSGKKYKHCCGRN